MSNPAAEVKDPRPWWMQLSRYHWYVFALCAMGWLFDTMDQKIFTTTRKYALDEFLPGASVEHVTNVSGWVTCVFILGWATGGLIFGVIGDKWGRAKTMAMTILLYALFTGLSAGAWNWWTFAICRFLTGLGVGGEFAAGASLLAEVIPNSARAKALGMLQALSAVGNVLGATLLSFITPTAGGWKILYLVGAAPALLAVFVRVGLKEPDKWLQAKAENDSARLRGENVKMGGIIELFSHPRWRRNAITGMCIAIAGVICLWAIGFWLPELIHSRYPSPPAKFVSAVEALIKEKDAGKETDEVAGLNTEIRAMQAAAAKVNAESEGPRSEADMDLLRLRDNWKNFATRTLESAANEDGTLKGPLTAPNRKDLEIVVLGKNKLISWGEIIQQIGAFLGMLCFGYIAVRFGRRPAFLIAFLLAWASVLYVYTQFKTYHDIYYMWPILGFCMLLPFGGYAIYFPELFPTRLRTTGTGLCYNVGRYVSAFGPLLLGGLTEWLRGPLKGKTDLSSFQVAALLVSSCYLIGIVALIWAPETMDQPLPEEERGFAH